MAEINENKTTQAPWDAPAAAQWLEGFDPWQEALRLINGSLRLETATHPQEIRAAASMVVLLCRDNLWPVKGQENLGRILEMAARQLSSVKQLYETKARVNPELQSNRTFRNLLSSIDQEIRIIEARMSDPKPKMPNVPPKTWGEYWTDP